MDKPKRRLMIWIGVVGGAVIVFGALSLPLLNYVNPNALLIAAVKRNDAAGVREALRKGANPNYHDVANDGAFARLVGHRSPGHTGASALMLAVMRITQDGPNRSMFTPIWEENAPLVAALLDAGAKPDDSGAEPMMETPLNWAAVTRRSETIRLLLAHGANVNPNVPGITPPLLRAASMGEISTIQLFLAHGANPQSRDFMGRTALIQAAAYSASPDCLRVLLKAGIDVNVRDRQGKTALGWAQARNWQRQGSHAQKARAIRDEMVSILTKAGGKP